MLKICSNLIVKDTRKSKGGKSLWGFFSQHSFKYCMSKGVFMVPVNDDQQNLACSPVKTKKEIATPANQLFKPRHTVNKYNWQLQMAIKITLQDFLWICMG